MEKKMFDKAGARIFHNARELRNNPTEAEAIFWLKLKLHFPQNKFRRQHPVSCFIADFYCHSLKLVIELDGSIHQLPEIILHDENKQQYLESIGLTVLRFTNYETIHQFEKVQSLLEAFIESKK